MEAETRLLQLATYRHPMTQLLRVGIILSIAAAVVAGGIWLDCEMSIDSCLDRGGAWDYQQARCEMAAR